VNPNTRNGVFVSPPRDETTVDLEASVFAALQPGMSPKAGDFWQEVLSDHIRNQHRKRHGMDPIIARWDRKAPEMRVVVVEEERDAAA
jgi:hypothetical protein